MPRMTHHARAFQVLLSAPMIAGEASATIVDPIFAEGFEAQPLLRYAFDGDGANVGTLAGYDMIATGAGFDTGKFDQAVSFGTGGYAGVGGMQAVLGTLAQVTVGFWYLQSAQLAGQGIWSLSNRSTAPYGGIQVGENGSTAQVCVSTTTSSYLGGACQTFPAPSTGVWHHWIIRYAGSGTGSAQGGPVSVYIDDVLVLTVPNDANNNPVFNPGIPDVLYIGGDGARMDDLRIYDTVFTQAQQCAYVIGGAWTGLGCNLP